MGQVCPAAIDAMDCSRPAHAHPPQVRDDLRAGGTTAPTQQAGIPPRMRWCRGLAAIQAGRNPGWPQFQFQKTRFKTRPRLFGARPSTGPDNKLLNSNRRPQTA